MNFGTTAERIKRIKPVPAAVQLLEKQLQNADPAVRDAGLDSIPKLTVPSEPLTDCIAKLLEHQNWYVRQSAADAVSRAVQCKGAAEVAVCDVAGGRMLSEDRYTRHCAARALAGVVAMHLAPEVEERPGFAHQHSSVGPGVPENTAAAAADEAAKLLSHQDPRICRNAVEALGQMGACAAPHAAQIGACICNPDRSVRNAVVHAFGSLGVSIVGGADEVGRGLAHPDGLVRRCATRALISLSHHSGAAAAAGAAAQLKNPDPVARQAAVACLADLGPLAAEWGKHLAARLEDDDSAVRITAVRALISGGPSMAPYVKHVRHRMNSEKPETRKAAVEAMRGLSRVSTVFARSIGKLMHEDPGDSVDVLQQRVQILDVLGGAGANAQAYLSDIVAELEHHDWAVRRAAIEALQDLGEHAAPAAGQVARRVLHHDPDVRRAAAEALGLMGVHSGGYSDRIVGTHATEEDEDVKRTCEQAMQMLTEVGALAGSSPASPPGSPKRGGR